ncbi:MAG: hypothetical protein PHQ72_14555 [Hespellia sp.]|nr:hypothetical protein [Hespellia sp.]
MVEETIREVKETEQKAEDILRDAKNQQREILEKAKLDAIHLKEEYLANEKAKAGQDMDIMQSECERLKAEAQKELEAEVSLLKEMALQKKDEAMKLVIGELI